VTHFLLKQNEIAGRIVDAMMAKDVHGMNPTNSGERPKRRWQA